MQLAIVIPYYKITFFDETLQSLANQTDKRFSVYIGNDASPDDCTLLLEKYKGKFDFVYKKFETNLGGKSLVKQWERCIDLVQDEKWLMILGDDDVLSNNVTAEFYNIIDELETEQLNVVRYATQVINEKSIAISNECNHPERETAIEFLIRKYKGGARSSLSEYIFRKSVVNEIKFKDFPLAWSSDVLGVIEFSERKNILTINKTLVYFRLSSKNITGNKDSVEKNNSKFKFYSYLLSNYGKHYPKELVTILFDNLEKTQFNNKKTPLRWLKLFGLYLKFSRYSRFLSLVSKINKSIK